MALAKARARWQRPMRGTPVWWQRQLRPRPVLGAASAPPEKGFPELTIAASSGLTGTSPLYTTPQAVGETGALPLTEASVLRGPLVASPGPHSRS